MFAKGRPSSHELVGVPGTVAGLALAHAKYGKLPWKDLVLPAVQLAEDGFPIDRKRPVLGFNTICSPPQQE